MKASPEPARRWSPRYVHGCWPTERQSAKCSGTRGLAHFVSTPAGFWLQPIDPDMRSLPWTETGCLALEPIPALSLSVISYQLEALAASRSHGASHFILRTKMTQGIPVPRAQGDAR